MNFDFSHNQQPVACTLRPQEFADRGYAWKQLLQGWMVSREATPEGGRITLRGVPGVASAARDLAELEAECCPWMRIQVDEADLVTLVISSSEPGGPEAIREMFRVS